MNWALVSVLCVVSGIGTYPSPSHIRRIWSSVMARYFDLYMGYKTSSYHCPDYTYDYFVQFSINTFTYPAVEALVCDTQTGIDYPIAYFEDSDLVALVRNYLDKDYSDIALLLTIVDRLVELDFIKYENVPNIVAYYNK